MENATNTFMQGDVEDCKEVKIIYNTQISNLLVDMN